MLRDRGIADDTLLVYTADNGPEGQWIHHPGHPGTNPGSTNGLRGRKRDLVRAGGRAHCYVAGKAQSCVAQRAYQRCGHSVRTGDNARG